MSRVRLLLLDSDCGLSTVHCEDLDDYYKHIKCDTIDIVQRKIGNKVFDIICDDEGRFKNNPRLSMISIYDDYMASLVGNLIFANHDAEGNTTSLSSEDIAMIKSEAVRILDVDNGRMNWAVLCS